jgi:uncharacterized membrane protein YoaK (UPF0700 family)
LSGRGTGDHSLRLLLAIWLAYVVGATLGSFGLKELSLWALAFPLGALVVAATTAAAYGPRQMDCR